jgi:hypothetical protein
MTVSKLGPGLAFGIYEFNVFKNTCVMRVATNLTVFFQLQK